MLRRFTIVLLLTCCGSVCAQQSQVKEPATETWPVRAHQKPITSYVREAHATYPAAKERFLAGLPPQHTFYVSTILYQERAKGKVADDVWVEVHTIKDEKVFGAIADTQSFVTDYKQGQRIQFPESDVLHWVIVRPDGSQEENPDRANDQRELRLNRTKWEHRGVTSYEIQLHEECFCPPPWSGPFRVSVSGGKVIKVVYEGQNAGGYWPGRIVSKKHTTDLTKTVEDVFAQAEKAINSTDQPHKIHYDSEYGFPKLIDVGNAPNMADDQWKLVVDKFRPAKR